MNKLTVSLILGFVLLNYNISWAISTHTYEIVQETLYFATSTGCLAFALIIFLSLKGGSLGKPWLFIFIGFLFAASGGVIHLLDIFKVLIYEYDLRLATLVTSCGSMVFFLIGLLFYKKGLE